MGGSQEWDTRESKSVIDIQGRPFENVFFGTSVDVDMYINVGQGFMLMTVEKGGGGTCTVENFHASLPHEKKKQPDLNPHDL